MKCFQWWMYVLVDMHGRALFLFYWQRMRLRDSLCSWWILWCPSKSPVCRRRTKKQRKIKSAICYRFLERARTKSILCPQCCTTAMVALLLYTLTGLQSKQLTAPSPLMYCPAPQSTQVSLPANS